MGERWRRETEDNEGEESRGRMKERRDERREKSRRNDRPAASSLVVHVRCVAIRVVKCERASPAKRLEAEAYVAGQTRMLDDQSRYSPPA